MPNKEIIDRLHNDEVIELETAKNKNDLFNYMIDNNIDPDDYRTNGKLVWLA